MHNRIRSVRQHCKMTQKTFGEKLGVSRDVYANIENARVDPNKTFVQLLCSIFNVNEEWLRTGNGEMFVETKDEFIVSLAGRFDLDSVDIDILSMYFEMPSEYRKNFRTYLKAVVDSAYQDFKKENPDSVATSFVDPTIEKEVESYRQELEFEKRATEKSSALPGAKEA